jgi:predicted  nucleic acid-binding Zn-ribbon protein
MRVKAFLFAGLLLIAYGCQTTYYKAWEAMGKEKRHLLQDNVEKARDEQEKASEQFKDALTRIKEIYGFEGGDLEAFYTKLREDYEACERRAGAVEKRIDTVEEIAADLFMEWENEIDDITNQKLKAKSRKSLDETKVRYARLSDAMVQARGRMEPALEHLQDYVLYLKHNLNAQAIGALRQEVGDIEIEVEALIQDMAKSIQEADDFLKTFE